MNKDRIKLSVIIPAYNEEKNLKRGVLDEVYRYLKAQRYNYEVLIVDDGSIDNTAKLIEDMIKDKKNFKLIRNEHGGKAITVMTGLMKSKGEIALFTDMDQSTPLWQIEKFFKKFESGYDVVIGERAGRKGAPMIRKIYAWGFTVLRNIILGFSFDTQCGFKAFRREVIDRIFPNLLKKWEQRKAIGGAVNAGFDIETLFIVKKLGYKIVQIPVEWHYVGSERVGIKAAIEALKDMLGIRTNDLKGEYNLYK